MSDTWENSKMFKAIVNLFSYGKKSILIQYENNHYITTCKKNYFFSNMHFSFYQNISIFVSLQRLKTSSSFQWRLICTTNSKGKLNMDYDVLLGQKMLKVKRSNTTKNFEKVYQNSRSPAFQLQPPYFFTLNKDF